jgi:cation diffusion facilitator family transporter
MAASGSSAPLAAGVGAARVGLGLRAVGLGAVANVALILVKAAAGLLGHSQGLVADAVHSSADLVMSGVVYASLLISRKPADTAHPYGHGRAEALSATFASFVICGAGLLVAVDSARDLLQPHREAPAWITLWVAAAALIVKLGLAWNSGRVGLRIKSHAVRADAREHLTDAAASAVVVAGILTARLVRPSLDSLGGLIVAGFIVYSAFGIFREAAGELMETNLDDPLRRQIVSCVEEELGLGSVSGVAGRRMADMTLVEIHLELDPALSLSVAAGVADTVKQHLKTHVPEFTHIVIEMNSSLAEPDALAVPRERGSLP